MKKIVSIIVLIITLFLITGCEKKYPELESDAIGFKMGSFIDVNDDDASYTTIEYNGRTYISYGTIERSVKESDIDKCIGYIIQDENASSTIDLDNKDTRVYTLVDDKDNNFLMVYYIGTTLMNQPDFYRAMDSKDKNVIIPLFINDLDYNYWK